MFIVADVIQRSVLIEGVLFRARYLGSTQLVCEGQPTKTTRMMQAEEAVSRIKVRSLLVVIVTINKLKPIALSCVANKLLICVNRHALCARHFLQIERICAHAEC